MKSMKHWCYYANVVRYLEKLEAGAAKKKQRGAYLVSTDDEGPHMIAGPDIYWHRGAGPMPDLEGLRNGAASVSKPSVTIAQSPPRKAEQNEHNFSQTRSPKQQR